MLTAELRHQLCTVDTPTICNALELAMGGRTADGFTYGTLIAAPTPLPPFVGYVRTARIRAGQASSLPAEEVRRVRLGYYRYVSGEAEPTIVVMQDLDERPGIGSFWGEVNSAVHQRLGVAGVLTDGSVRDLGDLSKTFPILAGSIGVSHAHVHVVDYGGPVEVFGLTVAHGDILHADRHGAVLIAPHYLEALPACIELVQRKEAPLLAATRSSDFTLAMLEAAIRSADGIH